MMLETPPSTASGPRRTGFDLIWRATAPWGDIRKSKAIREVRAAVVVDARAKRADLESPAASRWTVMNKGEI